jgi:hypothetical protein
MEEYMEQKNMCYYSRGCVNRCNNAIAQAQAMANHCKMIGLTPKFLSRCAECAEKNSLGDGLDCKI